MSMRRESGKLVIADLASKMSKLKVVGENLSEEERASHIQDLYPNTDEEVDFELFLKVSFQILICYHLFSSINFFIFRNPLSTTDHLFPCLFLSFFTRSLFIVFFYANLKFYSISLKQGTEYVGKN